jgi:hypothetical protein
MRAIACNHLAPEGTQPLFPFPIPLFISAFAHLAIYTQMNRYVTYVRAYHSERGAW